MKKTIIIFMMLTLSFCTALVAQDFFNNAANYFDSRSSFVNTALLGLKQAPEITLGYNRFFYNLSNDALQSAFLLVSYPVLNIFNLSAQTNYFSSQLFQRNIFSMGISRTFLGNRFGMGFDFGGASYSYNVDEFQLDDFNDPVLANRSSITRFDAGIGFFIKPIRNVYLGFSIKHLNKPSISLTDNTTKLSRFYHGGILFYNRFVTPFLSFTHDDYHNLVTFGIQKSLFDRFFLQGNYNKNDVSIHLGTNFNIGEQNVLIGYQMTMPQNELSTITENSHQLYLTYNFGKIEYGDFQIAVTPNVREIYPGETTDFQIDTKRDGKFDNPVILSIVSPQMDSLICKIDNDTLLPFQKAKLFVTLPKLANADTLELAISGESRKRARHNFATLVIKPFPLLSANCIASTESITIEEISYIKETQPILPYIFFDENSAQLSDEKYALIKENEDLMRYLHNQLKQKNDVLTQYRNVLNVIAKRLIDNPEMIIQINGYISDVGKEEGNVELAQKRAMAVRDYLVNICGVNEKQITIASGILPPQASAKADSLGQQENRRVEITALKKDISILAPITISEKEIKSSIEQIEFFIKNVVSEAGIKKWEFLIYEDGGDTIWSQESEKVIPEKIVLPIHRLNLVPDKKYLYQLTVKDNFGQRYQTPARQITTIAKKIVEKNIDIARLILFKFNSAELDFTSPILTRTLEEALTKLQQNEAATIEIIGYTDIIGNADYNVRLSRARAKAVADYFISNGIAQSRVRFKGLGSKSPLMNNEIPEGRMLNRRVELIISMN